MTTKELAALLNGREYGNEITKEEEAAAKEAGLVVVFGESDDLMEFRGAINGELNCYEGGTAYINGDGLFEMPYHSQECRNCRFVENERDTCATITALWCKGDFPWSYQTEIPHETFEIFEDGEKYCQGIVFRLADLRAREKYSVEEKTRMFKILRGVIVESHLEFEEKREAIEFITDLEEAINHDR